MEEECKNNLPGSDSSSTLLSPGDDGIFLIGMREEGGVMVAQLVVSWKLVTSDVHEVAISAT